MLMINMEIVGMNKYTINLLQAELLPQTPLLTLTRVVYVWVSSLFVMLVWLSINQFNLYQADNLQNRLTLDQERQASKLVKLEAKLVKNIADPTLTLKLKKIKVLMAHKEILHRQLTNSSRTYVAGFASAMTELSSLHHNDISLQKVHINVDDMSFSGIARVPEAVPTWLSAFEGSTLLSGKTFHNFKLTENEQHNTLFEVSTSKTLPPAGDE
jgi:hypothetical protein